MTVRMSSLRDGVGSWVRGAVQAGLVIALVLDTVRLRRRLAGQALPQAEIPSQGVTSATDRLRLLAAENVRIDSATLAHARAYAQIQRLDTLDLVPADLPTAQALDLLRMVDPATYRTDRLALGRGALHATLADEDLLRAAGISPQRPSLSAPELAKAIAQLKLHAPATTDLVVTPGLASNPAVLAQDVEVIATRHGDNITAALLHGDNTAAALLPELVRLGTLAAISLSGSRWALLPLGMWTAQPLAVFVGSRSPLRPTCGPPARSGWCSRRAGCSAGSVPRSGKTCADPVQWPSAGRPTRLN